MQKNQKKSFVVFLDVDGVLNAKRSCVQAPSGIYVGVDDARIAILSNSMKQTGADGVVLTTTWKNMREDDEDYTYLVKFLERYEITILGKTKDERVTRREEGIQKYLESHPEVEDFIILDDQHFGFENYNKLWESFIDTQGRGIEYSIAASKTSLCSGYIILGCN